MRKNSGKLTMALLGLALALLVGVLAGKDLIKDSYYDSEMADGYKLVYEVSSADAEVIASAEKVIAKRLTLLGASAVKTSVEGSSITAVVTGLSDIETKKTLMTRNGALSFRNSADELLMDGSVLDAEMPLSVSTNGDSTYIQIKVKDTAKFKEQTQALVSSTDKMMVLWVDFAEGQTYEAESQKNIPSYLGAATVSAAIDGDCYITTHHSAAETKELVALVSSGTLPASITEKSFEPVTAEKGENAASSAYWGILFATLAIACLLAFRYGVAGLVPGVMTIGYAAAFFKSNQLLGVVFNTTAIALFAISVATGLLIVVTAYEKARSEMLKGRNATASYDEAFKSVRKASWEACVAEIIVGLVITLLFSGTMRAFASGITAGGVCNLIFYLLLNNKIVSDLNASNYLSKSMYRISEKDLPDVEKGENYEKKSSKIDLAKYFNNKAALICAALLACGGIVVSAMNVSDNSRALFVVCIVAVVLAGYAYWQYRRNTPALFCAALTGFLAAACASLLMKNFGISLAGLAVAIVTAFLYLNELRNNYRVISREKITEEKLNNVINESIGALTAAVIIGLIAAIIIDVVAGHVGLAAVLWIASVFASVSVMTYFWLKDARKGNKYNKTRKSNKKELKENTIFGINEQR